MKQISEQNWYKVYIILLHKRFPVTPIRIIHNSKSIWTIDLKMSILVLKFVILLNS